jgi:hypothetical protein
METRFCEHRPSCLGYLLTPPEKLIGAFLRKLGRPALLTSGVLTGFDPRDPATVFTRSGLPSFLMSRSGLTARCRSVLPPPLLSSLLPRLSPLTARLSCSVSPLCQRSRPRSPERSLPIGSMTCSLGFMCASSGDSGADEAPCPS